MRTLAANRNSNGDHHRSTQQPPGGKGRTQNRDTAPVSLTLAAITARIGEKTARKRAGRSGEAPTGRWTMRRLATSRRRDAFAASVRTTHPRRRPARPAGGRDARDTRTYWAGDTRRTRIPDRDNRASAEARIGNGHRVARRRSTVGDFAICNFEPRRRGGGF